MPWGHYMVGELENDVGVGEPQGALEQHTPTWDHYVVGELFLESRHGRKERRAAAVAASPT